MKRLPVSHILVGVIALLLVGYCAARSYLLSFTHDEALSFFIINGDSYWVRTANHHILNSLMMGVCSRIFGNGELSLRLPNLLALIVYMLSCFLILRRLKHPVLVVSGFVLLSLNPFVLDFFNLARGYGLSLGFMMANLYCLTEMADSSDPWLSELMRGFGYVFGGLAVLSNSMMLNYHIAFVIADILLQFRNQKTNIANNCLLLGANVLLFAKVLPFVFMLKRDGELYYGGTGFWKGALETLITDSFYFQDYGTMVIGIVTAVLVSTLYLGVVLSVRQWGRSEKLDSPSVIFMILILMILAPIAQNVLFGTLYPKSRTALAYFPLMMLTLIFSCDKMVWMSKPFGKRMILSVIMVFGATFCFHFFRTANMSHTQTWFYDRNTKDVMAELASDHAKSNEPGKIRVGTNSLFWPAMNYYRITKGLDWLEPVSRLSLGSMENRYCYCFSEESEQIPTRHKLLRLYSDTKTALIKTEIRSQSP